MGMLALFPVLFVTYVWVDKFGMLGAAKRLLLAGLGLSVSGWGIFAVTQEPIRNWCALIGAIGVAMIVFGAFAWLIDVAFGRRK